jgi:hypothetical protein
MAAIPTLAAAAIIAASNTERWWYPTASWRSADALHG